MDKNLKKLVSEKQMKKRKHQLEKRKHKKEFNNKIILIGCGAIGRALVPLLFKLIKLDPTKFTIFDMDVNSFTGLEKFNTLGIKMLPIELTQTNIVDELITKLKIGQDDIIIDASYEINTNFMHKFCSEYGISYINSSVEVWKNQDDLKPAEYTFYSRIKSIEDSDKDIKIKKNNFLISMGCNPGNVNIWTLYALKQINEKTKKVTFKSYAELANKLGLKVVHVSEKDTQESNEPKKVNEYVNTWSSDAISWYDEAFSYMEIGWGTHEKSIPIKTNKELSNEYQIIIDGIGSDSFAISYTPINKQLTGMLIRHEECYTICRNLTLRNNDNQIIYKPSTYYVYKISDPAFASTQEVKKNKDNAYQTVSRLMTSDIKKPSNIKEGRDEVGCTLFFDSGDIYWVGSMLDIIEAREIYDNKYDDIINPTIIQVLAGYIGGLFYLIESIEKKVYRGFMTPEDLPVEKFIHWTRSLLGPFGVYKIKDWKIESKDKDNKWQFDDFLITK